MHFCRDICESGPRSQSSFFLDHRGGRPLRFLLSQWVQVSWRLHASFQNIFSRTPEQILISIPLTPPKGPLFSRTPSGVGSRRPAGSLPPPCVPPSATLHSAAVADDAGPPHPAGDVRKRHHPGRPRASPMPPGSFPTPRLPLCRCGMVWVALCRIKFCADSAFCGISCNFAIFGLITFDAFFIISKRSMWISNSIHLLLHSHLLFVIFFQPPQVVCLFILPLCLRRTTPNISYAH